MPQMPRHVVAWTLAGNVCSVMHPRISVSAMCSARWDMAADLAWWASAGITNVGIALRKLEALGVGDGARQVRDAGFRVTNLLGLGFDLSAPSEWPAHQARLAGAVEAATVMGAECFVLTTGSARSLSWEEAADSLSTAIAPVVATCGAAGIPFVIEHTNSLRVDVGFVHTLRDVIDLARRLGVGVLMECNACWAERGLEATIAGGIDVIRLVQVSDFVIGTLTTPDRAVPGDGDIPLGRILGQLERAGYAGVFDLEIIGPRIEAEGYESAITRSILVIEDLI
jgi:sugar phosphate isomerase/epimerase